jgi:hypothetical protein
MPSERRWSAAEFSPDPVHPIEGSVCATVWPTRSLHSDERWFDEVDVWTEGFQASTTQRARIQLTAVEHAFFMLEREHAEWVGVTLSFGTVERFPEQVVGALDAHALVEHRIVVLLRGSIRRLRSRYQLLAVVRHLRARQVPVGYRIGTTRVAMELKALDFLQPDFVKLPAPNSSRSELWDDLALEVQVAGASPERTIIGGVDSQQQLELARQMKVRFGQGSAVRPAYAPQTL